MLRSAYSRLGRGGQLPGPGSLGRGQGDRARPGGRGAAGERRRGADKRAAIAAASGSGRALRSPPTAESATRRSPRCAPRKHGSDNGIVHTPSGQARAASDNGHASRAPAGPVVACWRRGGAGTRDVAGSGASPFTTYKAPPNLVQNSPRRADAACQCPQAANSNVLGHPPTGTFDSAGRPPHVFGAASKPSNLGLPLAWAPMAISRLKPCCAGANLTLPQSATYRYGCRI